MGCFVYPCAVSERCELCGARWKEGHLKCHDCGAPKRTTLLPEEPAGAPIPDAAASLATGPVPHIEAFANEFTSSAPVAPSEPAADASAAGPVVDASAPTTPASASTSAAVPAATASASTSAAVPAPAAVSASHDAPGPNLVAPSAAAPRPVPGVPSAPLPRPGGGRGPWPLLIGVAVLAIGGVIAFFVLRSPEPAPQPETDQTPISISARGLAPPGCADLEALAGSWVFTTATTNARKEARIGMRGFFELQIDVNDCTAEATVTKIGRKGKPTFVEHKQPRATASLSTTEDGLYAFGFGARFELQNEDGQGVPLRITFAREGEQLVGAWRQVGERWDSSGMYGVLVGQREGDPRKIRVRRSEQPCAIQCAAPEDVAQVEQPSPEAIAQCRSACG